MLSHNDQYDTRPYGPLSPSVSFLSHILYAPAIPALTQLRHHGNNQTFRPTGISCLSFVFFFPETGKTPDQTKTDLDLQLLERCIKKRYLSSVKSRIIEL